MYKKILYIADEGIGNTILATPVVLALESHFENSEITFGTRGPSLKIPYGHVDTIDVTKDPFDKHYDMVLCSIWHYHFIKRIKEVKYDYFDKVEFTKPPPKMHESEMNMQLIRKLGFVGKTPPPFCTIKRPKFFDMQRSTDPPWNIGFANGCIGHPWERKEWPHEKEFIKLLAKQPKLFNIYILGGQREAERWNSLKFGSNVKNLCGLLDIDEVGWVMSRCRVVVSNDSGPGHVAACVRTNTIHLWGSTSLKKNRPLGPKVNIITARNLDCLECQYTARWSPCKDWKCMKNITPEMVYNKLKELLKF